MPWAAPARAAATYGTTTVTLPLGNVTNGGFIIADHMQPKIAVALSNGNGFGSAINFTLDTGSTGVIVGPEYWPSPPETAKLGPGEINYTSATGQPTYSGMWYQTTLLVGDANGNNITVAVPVLQINPDSCGTDCKIAMFGIGFARESVPPQRPNTQGPGGTQRAVPANNPLLNVIAVNGVPVTAATPNQPGVSNVVNGNLSSGYIVSPNGLTVGLTATNAAPFSMVPLTWNNATTTLGFADWNPAAAELTVNGVSGAGTVLNDTGIPYAIVEMSDTGAGMNSNCGYSYCLDNGIGVAVAIPQTSGAAAAYSYTVGGTNADPAAPPFTRWVAPTNGPFVNTGLPFFNQYTYLFDYVNGQVGFLDRTTPAGVQADLAIVYGVPAPAPAPLGLLAFGLAALAAAGRRRG